MAHHLSFSSHRSSNHRRRKQEPQCHLVIQPQGVQYLYPPYDQASNYSQLVVENKHHDRPVNFKVRLVQNPGHEIRVSPTESQLAPRQMMEIQVTLAPIEKKSDQRGSFDVVFFTALAHQASWFLLDGLTIVSPQCLIDAP